MANANSRIIFTTIKIQFLAVLTHIESILNDMEKIIITALPGDGAYDKRTRFFQGKR